jgi:hypothetical protein
MSRLLRTPFRLVTTAGNVHGMVRHRLRTDRASIFAFAGQKVTVPATPQLGLLLRQWLVLPSHFSHPPPIRTDDL